MERWLYSFLCLDCTATPYRLLSGTPHPDACQLFFVNRDSLFSYHKLSEAFLHRVWSLYVASHYKNSPDDLQLLSDAPAHMLFVLLAPQQDGSLPDVYCVAQVCLEGSISRATVQRELQKGARSAGDLIPWIVARQFLDSDFSQLSGARIVRIATHPDVQGMGYGRRTLQLLRQYFEGKIEFTGDAEESEEEGERGNKRGNDESENDERESDENENENESNENDESDESDDHKNDHNSDNRKNDNRQNQKKAAQSDNRRSDRQRNQAQTESAVERNDYSGAGDASLHELARPRKHLPSLLVALSDRRAERLHVSPFPRSER